MNHISTDIYINNLDHLLMNDWNVIAIMYKDHHLY